MALEHSSQVEHELPSRWSSYLKPIGNYIDRVDNLAFGHAPAGWDVVPFMEAGPTASRRGMLGHEHGMPTHRRLLSIIVWPGRREPRFNYPPSLASNDLRFVLGEIAGFWWSEAKTSAER